MLRALGLVFLVPAVAFAHDFTEEELAKQLQGVPEVGMDQKSAKAILDLAANFLAKRQPEDVGIKTYMAWTNQAGKHEMGSLPWQKGDSCKTPIERVGPLQEFSAIVRGMKAMMSVDGIAENKKLCVPEAIPAMSQTLLTESVPYRQAMVQVLSRTKGKEASESLARIAIFDLHRGVRENAIRALAGRPEVEFSAVLMGELRYPWPVVADHTAEAIGTLKIKSVVPELVKFLGETDPKLPVRVESKNKEERGSFVREVVRVNHLSNCILCHNLSFQEIDPLRGAVPMPGEKISGSGGYSGTAFIRADIVYLRQDFSVMLKVGKPGTWPTMQRYDFLTRTRRATLKETGRLTAMRKQGKVPESYPQRDSVLSALMSVTGMDLGTKTEDWQGLLSSGNQK